MAKPSGRSPTDVDAEPRERRFMKSALAILGETGRTDFTVLEVVERSKTSLRSFYQHFSTKDELLLALIDKIMSESAKKWREDTTGLESTAALRVLIDRICTPAESTTQDKVNRGLTYYNDHLAETLPREYARVLSPLHELIKDIINRGIADGSFRAGPLSAQQIPNTPAPLSSHWRQYTNLLGSGINFWGIDPKAMDDPLAFWKSLYPSTTTQAAPGITWAVPP